MQSQAILRPADRRRYVRQLLLAEIGEAGQERLLATRARLQPGADARAAQVASDYLARAGVALSAGDEGVAAVEIEAGDLASVEHLAGMPSLEEAAAALQGAFAAVEAIKAALAIGVPARLPPSLQLGTNLP